MPSNTASLVRTNGATSPVQIRATVTYSGTYEVVNNRSLYYWSVEYINTSGSVYGTGNYYSIAGSVGLGAQHFTIATSTTATLNSGSFWVTHNADGTASNPGITLYASSDNFYVGNGSVAVSATAPRIPRGPRVRVAGVWKNTVAYVRTGGVWKIAIPYVRHGGTWKVGGN